jgi:hypothetical protein
MQPTYIRIIGLLLLLNCFVAHAKEKPGFFALSGGCITSAPQYVLYNNLPGTITATTAGGGSCSSYNYQWQRSTDNVYFTDIPGATGQNLSFTAALPNSPQTTYFQRRTVCGNEVAYTGSAVVNMIEKYYYNEETQGTFTRNNCAAGATPATYTYVVRANKYSSPLNQDDANAKAQKDVADSGQYYANINAVCTWYSVQKNGVYTRNNCATGGTGGSYNYIVNARKYTSNISQDDADAKAQKEVNDSGQVYANRLTACTWLSAAASGTYTKDNCMGSTTPTSMVYNVAASKYSSNISQDDANAKAQKEVSDSGQVYANRNGVCQNLFISMLSGAADPGVFSVTVKNLSGTVLFTMSRDFRETVNYAYAVPAASGYIVEVASMSAMYAEVNGVQKTVNSAGASWNAGSIITIYVSKNERYYNDAQSSTFYKDCPQGYASSPVPFGVAANRYGSFVSKQDANNQALVYISANGPTNANNNGTCTVIQNVTVTLNNSFLREELYGCTVSFYRAGRLWQTVTFPATISGTIPVTLPADSYTMTFTIPKLGQPFTMGFKLAPTNTTWSQSSGVYTLTTGTVTFAFGTAYTLTATTRL